MRIIREINRYNDTQVSDIFMLLDLERKSMEYQLSNNFLTVSIKSAGAEITSIQSKDGLEYIWCGDEKFWGRHAPILFPIVGKVLENEYTYQGQSYGLSQHGFARDSEFEVEAYSNHQITFLLHSNEKTKEKYPFDFILKLHYELQENKVKVGYEVQNIDQKEIYFSIGGHPAFNCPAFEDETLEDYVIEFEVEEEAQKLGITPEVYLSGEREDYKVKTIPLCHHFFKDGVTILTKLQSQTVTLKSLKHDYRMTMSREQLPFLGLWSPEKGAPFVCIEPWVGHTDYITASKEISEKKDFVSLEVGETFKCDYTMTFEK
ncbi:MAG: aldose 1-epimerase family protein [Cellulosilyticum sp.]|nr:aldose 1-epimerase family protein [Cellulosilyticum sp.]